MNLKFICIRKYGGLEWEAYKEISRYNKEVMFLAVCHKFSKSIYSLDWDSLWVNIIEESKDLRRSKR